MVVSSYIVPDWFINVGLSYGTGTIWFDEYGIPLFDIRRGATVFGWFVSIDIRLSSSACNSLRDKCCTIAQPMESPKTLIAVRNRSLKKKKKQENLC